MQRCDICNHYEDMGKKHPVGRDDNNHPVTHHECPAKHMWHIVYAGNETQRFSCNCQNY